MTIIKDFAVALACSVFAVVLGIAAALVVAPGSF